MRRLFAQLLSIVALALSGCASAPEPAVKPQFASVYIFRSEAIAPKVRMKVEIDGGQIGETGPGSFIYAEVTPGVRRIVSRAENVDTLEIELVAGKTYYVWQEVRLGLLSARARLKLMTDEEGKRGLTECSPAAPK